MKQIHLHGKAFDECDFRGLVIGGQNDADTIRFVIPKTYAGEVDLSDSLWSFYITYENKEGQGDTVLLTKTLSNQSETIYLDWKPGQTATQVEGKLTCQVFGTKAGSGDAVCRFTTLPFAVYISKWLNPDPITQSLPTVIEQALELMAEYNAQLEDAFDAKDSAVESAKIAERYAKGTEGGVAVESGTGYHDNSKYYSELSKQSQTVAKASEDAALASKNAAASSQSAAKTSETNAKASETAAKNSQTAAKASEDAALASKNAAASSQSAAKTSETNAKASETAAKNSQTAAKASEDEADASAKAAAQSQSAAKASEDKAKASETAAKESEEKALASEKAAAQSESAAKASEDKAKASETAAKSSEEKALASEKAAAQSESAAKSSEDNAKASETAAKGSEEKAAQSESAAEDYSHISERFAKGTEGGQPVSSGDGYQDNSKYYKELAEETVTVATQRMDQLDEKIEKLLSTNRAYSTTIGDGVTKVFVIRHNLQSDKYLAQVWSNVDGQPSRWKLEKTDLNTATITFESAPPQDGVTVVFVGVAQGEAPSDESLAAAAQSTAAAKAAERFAKGTEDGQPVSSGDGYQDNSKYYKDLAEETVTLATQRMDQLDEKILELLTTNRAFSATIGDGSTKVFTIRHDLQSEDYLAQVWSNIDGQPSRWKLEKTDLNTATITFESAPPQDGVTVVFVGVAQAALSFVAGVKWQNVEDVMVTAEQLSADLALSDSDIMAAFEERKN